MKKTKMVCVACPIGCDITVEFDADDKIASISGHTCKRGVSYAENEITNPTRSLTTTVRVMGGRKPLVSVRSAQPVPKPLLRDCVAYISAQRVSAPVKLGDVIVKNILDTGVDIVATNHCY